MDKDVVLKQTEVHVRNALEGESSGHDWWHVYRVWKTAIYIGECEEADQFVVQLAALLHDIGDWKAHEGDISIGPRLAREWLERLQVSKSVILEVCDIVQTISFKGAGVKSPMKTTEGMVVQDADRLDAIGAIGIVRACAYGGHKGREIYNPNIPPQLHISFEEYKKNKSPTINHFYEKLLLLKDRMNTDTAKKMAESRHKFMEQFLERFFEEWDGKV